MHGKIQKKYVDIQQKYVIIIVWNVNFYQKERILHCMEYCADPNLNVLLRAALEGNADAVEALLGIYAPLIESQILAFANADGSADERDDLRQEASIAFCNAVAHYDRTQNVSFGAFAKVCIRNRLVSYQRKKLRQPPTVSLEDKPSELSSEKADPLQKLLEKEDFLALCRQIESLLSPYENRIWWLYVSGHTASEIAQRLVREERSVQNAIYRIRKKLRSALPNQ